MSQNSDETPIKQVDGRDRIDDLKKVISKLESMIERGQGNVCIRVGADFG